MATQVLSSLPPRGIFDPKRPITCPFEFGMQQIDWEFIRDASCHKTSNIDPLRVTQSDSSVYAEQLTPMGEKLKEIDGRITALFIEHPSLEQRVPLPSQIRADEISNNSIALISKLAFIIKTLSKWIDSSNYNRIMSTYATQLLAAKNIFLKAQNIFKATICQELVNRALESNDKIGTSPQHSTVSKRNWKKTSRSPHKPQISAAKKTKSFIFRVHRNT